ncbi:hypothetical protein [Bradyrhizobium sp. SZCCHNR2028]|uniref:hypothetical protein n=1 Tax=unclassified Bradyrhizobium TaxID=2631580 RepID=UPI0039657B46
MTKNEYQRSTMRFRLGAAALAVLSCLFWSSVEARITTRLPDLRSEFVRQCAPHMLDRWAHPEAVCSCLHDHAAAMVEDADLREALLRGISETGVPTIETDWVPAPKQAEIGPTFTKIAKPALQCMFDPAS